MKGVGKLGGWAWIFILEGIVTIAFGAALTLLRLVKMTDSEVKFQPLSPIFSSQITQAQLNSSHLMRGLKLFDDSRRIITDCRKSSARNLFGTRLRIGRPMFTVRFPHFFLDIGILSIYV